MKGYKQNQHMRHYKNGKRTLVNLGVNTYKSKSPLSLIARQALINKYKQKNVSKVNITKKRIRLQYDNHNLSYPIKKIKHLETIGNWAHKLSDNTVKIDSDVSKRNINPLLVHEAVEQYITKKKNLPLPDSHKLATQVEKRYAKRKGINWKNYQSAIWRTPG